MSEIAHRVERVLERLAVAEARAGRPPGSVTLVAITKAFSSAVIREGVAAGLRVLGENRVQEAEEKVGEVGGVVWHMVGHVQRNKARKALELFSLIHSLDSERLARRLDEIARERGRPAEALVQVNLSGEGTKHGVDERNLPGLLDACASLTDLSVTGLMTVPAPSADPEDSRPVFRRLRELMERERARGRRELAHLSMGMTGDFEVAVEEGATLVRVGRALFGKRPG